MEQLAAIAEAIAATTKKSEKVRLLADYLRAQAVEEAAVAAVFLSGRAFPAWEEATLQVGGALLVKALLEVSGKREPALQNAYRKTGDLGAAAYELLNADPSRRSARAAPLARDDNSKDGGDKGSNAASLDSREPHVLARDDNSNGALARDDKPFNNDESLNVVEVARRFRTIAGTRGAAAKAALVRDLLTRATPLEAKYLIKIITGELRIGLKESLVEEAIAAAFGASAKEVQRANMLLGDIGETLRLAAAHQLPAARMRLFHPLGFMLASPVESAREAFDFFAHAQVEDKYDGIRAQAHCGGDHVRLFSRTLDDVTESFPELVAPLEAFEGVILDGEVLAWDFAGSRALPFSELQKRLGRKKVNAAVMKSTPVAYVVFDVLYANGELVIDRPLGERGALLDRVFAEARLRRPAAAHKARLRVHDVQGKLAFEPAIVTDETPGDEPVTVLRAPVLRADSPAHLEELFTRAQARGNEGLMIKDVQSVYTPGRRGRSWLKLKRELATLDVVVTSVEWGHGKRIKVLSDYTFAVRDGERLVNVGKAYSGLTDREIAKMTEWFLAHTTVDHGFWRAVEPKIVIEVAFNAVMRSDRHNSGYALRFPRILRLRPDKLPEEIDTLERVHEVYERQKLIA